MNKLNKQGKTIIKNFEGLRLKAYRDIAGVWTIGYGSTRNIDGSIIKYNDKLNSERDAENLLDNTLSLYVNAVNDMVKVALNQNQFNAMVSFAYNVGIGALQKSTLLKKLNRADYTGAAEQFLVWDKITDPVSHQKIVSKTLAARRQQEQELFLK